jgi:hypothetical protein
LDLVVPTATAPVFSFPFKNQFSAHSFVLPGGFWCCILFVSVGVLCSGGVCCWVILALGRCVLICFVVRFSVGFVDIYHTSSCLGIACFWRARGMKFGCLDRELAFTASVERSPRLLIIYLHTASLLMKLAGCLRLELDLRTYLLDWQSEDVISGL